MARFGGRSYDQDKRRSTAGAKSNATGQVRYQPGMHFGDLVTRNRRHAPEFGQRAFFPQTGMYGQAPANLPALEPGLRGPGQVFGAPPAGTTRVSGPVLPGMVAGADRGAGGPQGLAAAILNRPMLPITYGGTQISQKHANASTVGQPSPASQRPFGQPANPNVSTIGQTVASFAPGVIRPDIPPQEPGLTQRAAQPPSPPAGVPQFMQPEMTSTAAKIAAINDNPTRIGIANSAEQGVAQGRIADTAFGLPGITGTGADRTAALAFGPGGTQATGLSDDVMARVNAAQAVRNSSQPLGMAGFMPERTATGQPIFGGRPQPPEGMSPEESQQRKTELYDRLATQGQVNPMDRRALAAMGLSGASYDPGRTPTTVERNPETGGVTLFGQPRTAQQLQDSVARLQNDPGIQRRLARQGRREMEGVSAVPTIAQRVQQRAEDNPGAFEALQQRTGRTFGMPSVGAGEASTPTFGSPREKLAYDNRQAEVERAMNTALESAPANDPTAASQATAQAAAQTMFSQVYSGTRTAEEAIAELEQITNDFPSNVTAPIELFLQMLAASQTPGAVNARNIVEFGTSPMSKF